MKPIINELWSLLVVAAIFTGIMIFLPTYPESDYWGKFMNNFLLMVGFYFAARLALNFTWGPRR